MLPDLFDMLLSGFPNIIRSLFMLLQYFFNITSSFKHIIDKFT